MSKFFHLLKVNPIRELLDHGAGRIRTDDLQRPRLASYQARRQPLICLFQNCLNIILGMGFGITPCVTLIKSYEISFENGKSIFLGVPFTIFFLTSVLATFAATGNAPVAPGEL